MRPCTFPHVSLIIDFSGDLAGYLGSFRIFPSTPTPLWMAEWTASPVCIRGRFPSPRVGAESAALTEPHSVERCVIKGLEFEWQRPRQSTPQTNRDAMLFCGRLRKRRRVWDSVLATLGLSLVPQRNELGCLLGCD